jgi:hypothetical protein
VNGDDDEQTNDEQQRDPAAARVTTGDTQYDYVDRTKPQEEVTPLTARGDEATQAELNPAYYPARTKPEALQNEAEKKGAEFPGGGQVQAALARNAEAEGEEVDTTDPEVANPPAPGANLGGAGTQGEQSTGSGERDTPSGRSVEDTILSRRIPEVMAYARNLKTEGSTSKIEELLDAEKSGQNRSTLVSQLENLLAEGEDKDTGEQDREQDKRGASS